MSEPKVRVTREELEGHLRDQIRFLGSSSESFDEGLRAEAKRLATSLRILFHDTRHSKSLLGQLDRLDGHFISTAFPVDAESLGSHLGLIGIRSGPRGTKYFALLDHAQNRRWLPFDDWWSEVVFIDESGREFSRRDLVLATADKHGGAHVDSELDEAFHSLASGKSLGWITETDAGPKALPGGLEETLRQISHEVLATLLPTYTKKPELRGSAFAGMSVKLVDKGASQKRPPAAVRDTFERNDPCPCGSGKKFKKCHGALARGLPNKR